MLEENTVFVISDGEKVQTDSFIASLIPASEKNDESHFDHSQPLIEPQVIKRNPSQTRKPPTRLHNYVTYASRHLITESISFHEFSTSHAAFLSEIDKHCETRSFQEASLIPQWNQAMADELHAPEENNTWSLVQLPPGKKVVGSRWI
ncbi:hypothetical protein ACFX16_013413 [Malus domestica]